MAEIEGAVAAPFDVTDEAACVRAVEALGQVDVLVNNAGITIRRELVELETDEWRRMLDVNLTGAFVVSRLVAPGMIERGSGKIVNVCSVMSELARPTVGAYAATKGALKMLTRSMCAEWARHGIQANGIAPGYVRTDLNAGPAGRTPSSTPGCAHVCRQAAGASRPSSAAPSSSSPRPRPTSSTASCCSWTAGSRRSSDARHPRRDRVPGRRAAASGRRRHRGRPDRRRGRGAERRRGRRRGGPLALPRLHRPARALGAAVVRGSVPDGGARAGDHDAGDQPGRPRARARHGRALGRSARVPERARGNGPWDLALADVRRVPRRARREPARDLARPLDRPRRRARRGRRRRAAARDPGGARARCGSEVRAGFEAGANNLSFGLVYFPGAHGDTEELVAVAEVAAEFDAPLVPHVRNEGAGVLEAMDEMLEVSRRSGASLHVSHLKSMADEALIEPLLEKLEGADGVTFDQYPYGAGCTLLASLLPAWAQEGGAAETLERLRDPDALARIAARGRARPARLGEHARDARPGADRRRGREHRRPRRRPRRDGRGAAARVRARRPDDPPLRLRRRRPGDRRAPADAARLGRDLRRAAAPAGRGKRGAIPRPLRAAARSCCRRRRRSRG